MTREEAKREIDFLDYYLQNHTDDYGEESHTAMMMAIQALEQEPSVSENPNNCEMRDATLEERESIDKYIKSISKPTGVKFGALEQEPCEDCRNCKKWDNCECGRKGHINGTSIGYSIGECKDYEPCEDAVSRKALISHIEKQSREWGEDYDAQQILGDIEDMPSVKPQERTGHWILSGGYWRCSECKEKALLKLDRATGNCREYVPIKSNYCPHCGVRMESEKNE